MELGQQDGKRNRELEQRRAQATGTKEAANAAIALPSEKVSRGGACVDLRRLASSMGVAPHQVSGMGSHGRTRKTELGQQPVRAFESGSGAPSSERYGLSLPYA